ncbi:hypothetical protein AMTRI_Chr09g33610 [Amborella trichopoda]
MTGGSLGLRTGSYGSLHDQSKISPGLPVPNNSPNFIRKPSKMLISGSREKERFIHWIFKIVGRRKAGMLILVVFSLVIVTSLMSTFYKEDDASEVDLTRQRPSRPLKPFRGHEQITVHTHNSPQIVREPDIKKDNPPVPSTVHTHNSPQTVIEPDTKKDNPLVPPPDINNGNSLNTLAEKPSVPLFEIPLQSRENKTLPPPPDFSALQLPPGHPCEDFTFPPPPADKKRTGPRPCPVCYVPVEEAIRLVPATPSDSPVLKHLSYVVDQNIVLPQKSVNPVDEGGSVFGGYPSLKQRDESFNIKETMEVYCGFVGGNRPGNYTGFDIDEEDLYEMDQCGPIVVASAIFANYDEIQQPKNISEAAKRHVCFYMFIDEVTRDFMVNSSILNDTKKVGLWRIVVVRNLPYQDARRNGKVPKLLLHRLFLHARYSIWIDGKLELVRDPYELIERFLLRRNATFSISKHYRRFNVFEEAEANKAAGKYYNSSIDRQIEFYRSEGLTPYSEAKLPIISDVPEGCVIIREHIPITNLFTCNWFNEVDRFTSRDQLSFSTVRDKVMTATNWVPYMFQDCERRNFVIQAYHRDVRRRSRPQPPALPVIILHPPSLYNNLSERAPPLPEKGAKTSSRRQRARDKKPGSRRRRLKPGNPTRELNF